MPDSDARKPNLDVAGRLLRLAMDDDESPKRVAHYRLIHEAGRGGQGIVYLAEDERLHRKVALKMLRLPDGDVAPERMARLSREARAASKLDHPAICQIYDVGTHETEPFIAMRWVDGRPLDEVIAEENAAHRSTSTELRERASRFVRIIEKVARALHAAHRQGLVHRDVKPSNILVTEDGEPVLLDFGLVRIEADDSATITQPGGLLGTPAYMAPEQISSGIPVGPATDVYALGLCLYEALTNVRPFEAATINQLFRQILFEQPAPIRQRNSQVSKDLQTVVLVALQKNPQHRYASASELADDLSRIQRGEPIRARPASVIQRITRWSQRNPAIAGLTALVLALLVTTVVATTAWLRDVMSLQQANARDALISSARLGESPLVAAHLARLAVEDTANVETVSTLLEVLATSPPCAVIPTESSTVSAAWHPRGEQIATADAAGTLMFSIPGGTRVRAVATRTERVRELRYSPTGRLLGFACSPARVGVVSTASGALMWVELESQEAHSASDAVVNFDFSPDGRWLVTANLGSLELRRIADGGLPQQAPAFELVPEPGYGFLFATFLDSDTLAVVQERNAGPASDTKAMCSAKVIRAREGKWDPALGSSAETPGDLTVFAVARNRSRFAAGTRDGRVLVWDAKTLARRRRPAEVRHSESNVVVTALAFAPDASGLASGARDRRVRVWDENMKRRLEIPPRPASIRRLGYDPTGSILAIGRDDGRTEFASRKGLLPIQLRGPANRIEGLAFDPGGSGRVMMYSEGGHGARVYAIAGNDDLRSFAHEVRLYDAAFLPDGSVVTGSGDGQVSVWSRKGLQPTALAALGRAVRSLRGSEIGSTIFVATAAPGQGLQAVQRDTRSVVPFQRQLRDTYTSVATSRGGDLVAAGNDTGYAAIHRRDGAHLLLLEHKADSGPNWVLDVEFCPDGSVATASGSTVSLWDIVRNGRVRTGVLSVADRTLKHPSVVNAIAVSASGSILASACNDQVARIWSIPGGVLKRQLIGHRAAILDIAISPDERFILTGARDGTVVVWSQSGERVLELRGHRGPVWSVAFSTTGNIALTASDDGTARLWPLDTSRIRAIARSLPPLNAIRDWRRHVPQSLHEHVTEHLGSR